jgi:CRISPR/Cas system CSM-associated protein Csm5 (group 7 of RAMP superfamily)
VNKSITKKKEKKKRINIQKYSSFSFVPFLKSNDVNYLRALAIALWTSFDTKIERRERKKVVTLNAQNARVLGLCKFSRVRNGHMTCTFYFIWATSTGIKYETKKKKKNNKIWGSLMTRFDPNHQHTRL